MHDICEGVIPFLHKNLFKYCIDKKVFSEDELKGYIFQHDYGVLNEQNVPSVISLASDKLKQNASQHMCLLHHLPYILYSFKDNAVVMKVWPCIVYLLGIVRIIYSARITEIHLQELDNTVSAYLNELMKCFDVVSLTMKHHLIIHYAMIIRFVGPLVHMSTMRFEMFHKRFTNYTRRSNNFINVSKSLALNNQKSILSHTPYQNKISHAKLKNTKCDLVDSYLILDKNLFDPEETTFVTKWLKINNNYYRKGLMLKDNDLTFHEITEIFFQKGNFFFGCEKYDLMEFDTFLFSREVRKRCPKEKSKIEEKTLLVKKSFMITKLNDKSYLIAGCLDIPISD